MSHKLKMFHPDVKYSDSFYGVWLVFAIAGAIFGTFLGFAASPWFWFGWTPVVAGLGWAMLMTLHEAYLLSSYELKLYKAYNRLPKELKTSFPKLTPDLIQAFTGPQQGLIFREIEDLLELEENKAKAEKELDPTATNILEALRDLKKVTHAELETLQKLKEMP